MTKQFLEYVASNVKLETQLTFRQQGVEGLAVRVEASVDELFWRPLIEKALPNKVLQFYPYFSEASTTTGKSDILKYVQFGDKQLIFCIDSDADYLLEKPILQTSFLFHTYVDGIENFWCYAEGLDELMQKVTNTEGSLFDFSTFFETYSTIIYPYIVCALFSMKEADNLLSRSELGDNAGFNSMVGFVAFEAYLKQKYAHLLEKYAFNLNFKNFERRLNQLGLTKKEAYLFVRCHDILDRVTAPLMRHIGNAHFKKMATNKEKIDFENRLKANPYKTLVQNNTSVENCMFYQRIIQDIQTAF